MTQGFARLAREPSTDNRQTVGFKDIDEILCAKELDVETTDTIILPIASTCIEEISLAKNLENG